MSCDAQRLGGASAAAVRVGERGSHEPALELLSRRLERRLLHGAGLCDVSGQRCLADSAPARRLHRHPRDHILELANVARPFILRQGSHGIGTERGSRAYPAGCLIPEPCSQQRDITGAIAKRGHLDADDVEAKSQVCAEAAGRRLLFEPSIGGRNDPDIDPTRDVLPDPSHFPILKHAEQLGLRSC